MRREWFLAAAVLALAACSGDDDASPATTSSDVPRSTTTAPLQTTEPTADPTTTAATTTTTVPPTTTTPPPTTPPSTDPPATTTLPEGVPPRVTFPDDPEKQAVVDAVYAFSDLIFAAQADPTNPDLRAQIDVVAGEPVRQRFIDFLDRVAADGEAFVDLPGRSSYFYVFEPSVSVVDGSGLVDGCAVDRTAQIEVGGNADGSDRIIDDTEFSAAQSYSLSSSPNGWVVVDLTVFGEWEGQVECGEF